MWSQGRYSGIVQHAGVECIVEGLCEAWVA
jgi:hypothetical protein